jgi:hypothetical protein
MPVEMIGPLGLVAVPPQVILFQPPPPAPAYTRHFSDYLSAEGIHARVHPAHLTIPQQIWLLVHPATARPDPATNPLVLPQCPDEPLMINGKPHSPQSPALVLFANATSGLCLVMACTHPATHTHAQLSQCQNASQDDVYEIIPG